VVCSIKSGCESHIWFGHLGHGCGLGVAGYSFCENVTFFFFSIPPSIFGSNFESEHAILKIARQRSGNRVLQPGCERQSSAAARMRGCEGRGNSPTSGSPGWRALLASKENTVFNQSITVTTTISPRHAPAAVAAVVRRILCWRPDTTRCQPAIWV